jgi:hypothetical protein
MARTDKKHSNESLVGESGMQATAKAEQPEATVLSSDEVWRHTPWGFRKAFIDERIELDGYSLAAAEKYAEIWEQGERQLIQNQPVVLVSE